MLPRIPVPIERKMKVQLLLHQEKKKRAAANESIKDRYFSKFYIFALLIRNF